MDSDALSADSRPVLHELTHDGHRTQNVLPFLRPLNAQTPPNAADAATIDGVRVS
jgi:hypothetical protein